MNIERELLMKSNHKYYWSIVYDRTKNNCDSMTASKCLGLSKVQGDIEQRSEPHRGYGE